MQRVQEAQSLPLRPNKTPFMYQTWRRMIFLHCHVAHDLIQANLPPGLGVDTFEGEAWLSLVGFQVRDLRLRGLPSTPLYSHFDEINVRTYVFDEHNRPGIWFYSLDASNWLDCKAAQLGLGLPYRYTRVAEHSDEQGNNIIDAAKGGRYCRIRGAPSGDRRVAVADTLPFFLQERYLLFSQHRGKLKSLQIHHKPYEFREFQMEECRQNLLQIAGFPASRWLFAWSVDQLEVEFFFPQKVHR
jgi:uncharacterized protein YqjF (DUF2071 family)